MLTHLLNIAVLQLSVFLIPGQNFVLVVMYSVTCSRKVGFYAAIGATLGTGIYAIAALFGLRAFMHEFPSLFTITRFLGAAYLIYIGLRCAFSKAPAIKVDPQIQLNRSSDMNLRALKDGLIANILNPRVGLFFISLFSQIRPETWETKHSFYFTTEVILLAFTWFSLVAIVFSIPSLRMKFLEKYEILKYVFAALLIGSSIKMMI